ncbi:uncharacterized protein EI90DRAFT_140122 [Cantharellus anzutake]|uniref:uncharacterized protein n=1 Tax=Cantharellus anzutake TaxID=1750568 RepID=UPI0019063F50|nr:uncharacterized protein EI90DRAFT_140122 [Cantharellus anzutake]KAF8317751.1 hypothetical protein EI90DRAFT_140122 [Cantharellus anzutake]
MSLVHTHELEAPDTQCPALPPDSSGRRLRQDQAMIPFAPQKLLTQTSTLLGAALQQQIARPLHWGSRSPLTTSLIPLYFPPHHLILDPALVILCVYLSIYSICVISSTILSTIRYYSMSLPNFFHPCRYSTAYADRHTYCRTQYFNFNTSANGLFAMLSRTGSTKRKHPDLSTQDGISPPYMTALVQRNFAKLWTAPEFPAKSSLDDEIFSNATDGNDYHPSFRAEEALWNAKSRVVRWKGNSIKIQGDKVFYHTAQIQNTVFQVGDYVTIPAGCLREPPAVEKIFCDQASRSSNQDANTKW